MDGKTVFCMIGNIAVLYMVGNITVQSDFFFPDHTIDIIEDTIHSILNLSCFDSKNHHIIQTPIKLTQQ